MKYWEATPIVLVGAAVVSFIVMQSLIIAMLVGTFWALIGVVLRASKIPWKDEGRRWRSGENSKLIKQRTAYTGITSVFLAPIAFVIFQGNTLNQIFPWIMNMAPEFQVPYVAVTHGIGFVLNR